MQRDTTKQPVVQKRRRLRLMDESSSDDKNALIGSRLNIKKVKIILYMTEPKGSAIPDKVAS